MKSYTISTENCAPAVQKIFCIFVWFHLLWLRAASRELKFWLNHKISIRHTVHWADRQQEGDRLKKIQPDLKIVQSILFSRQHVYPCQYFRYRSNILFIPGNAVPLLPSPFDAREECLNTNEESTPSSALLSVVSAEGYYRVTPGTPLALSCHANQTIDCPQKWVLFLECCSI